MVAVNLEALETARGGQGLTIEDFAPRARQPSGSRQSRGPAPSPFALLRDWCVEGYQQDGVWGCVSRAASLHFTTDEYGQKRK